MSEILKKVTVVMPVIKTWTGRQVLTSADRKKLGISDTGGVISLGHKKIVDPKEIAVFQTLRKRAERACAKVGVHFLGGYAVPMEKVKELLSELQAMKTEFEAEAKSLSQRIGQLTKQWVDEHEEWKEILASSEASVRNLSFSYHAVVVQPVDGDTSTSEQASKLGDKLFDEVSKEITQYWEKSLKGRSQVTQRALRPLKHTLEKVRGLSFVDPRANKVADYIEAMLGSLPKSGPLNAAETAKVAGLALALTEGPEAIPDELPVVEASNVESIKVESEIAESVAEPEPKKVANWF